MPEAFPDFDKKPTPPATPDPDGTAEGADSQEGAQAAEDEASVGSEPRGTPVAPSEVTAARASDVLGEPGTPSDPPRGTRSGAQAGTRPDLDATSAASPDDPYVSPYHSGVRGSGAGRAEREPASESELDDQEFGELDGTGVAGLMRRWAVGRNADAAGRGTVLDLADHVEAVESRIGGVLGKPLRDRGMDGLARRVERNPLAAIAGAVLAGWVVNRMLD